jgi:MraZ protein
MTVFSGEHLHSLDDKGRVVVPSMYRDALADGAFLTRGMDRCLWLFPEATWSTISSRLRQMRTFSTKSRLRDRRLCSGAHTTIDAQRRLMIPPILREYAGLAEGQAVVIAGINNRLELWNRERWERCIEADSAALEEAMEEIDL